MEHVKKFLVIVSIISMTWLMPAGAASNLNKFPRSKLRSIVKRIPYFSQQAARYQTDKDRMKQCEARLAPSR